jgi:prepilin-type N-terminal cleavage/methylation domain-containing protein
MKNVKNKPAAFKNGFTLIEMSVAIVILGMIVATVFTVINRAVETIGDWQTKMEAFEIARTNMEKLLAQKTLSDTFEYGTSEINPEITWETTVESFYEPVSNKMWMRAVCTSEYTDSNGLDQKIELTHWLTSLSKKQIMQILEQQQREQEYSDKLDKEKDQQNPDQQENPNPDQQDNANNNENNNNQTDSGLGPPPAGYNSWDEVPAEELFKILQNQSGLR